MLTGIIHTAKEMSNSQLGTVVGRFAQIYNEPVRFSQRVEPELIGGILVEIGGKIYDGSLKGQLDALLEQLQNSER